MPLNMIERDAKKYSYSNLFASLHSIINVLQSVAMSNKFKELELNIKQFKLFMTFVPHLQASMASVNLSAQAYWTPDPSFKSYLNYGAGTSEVSLIQNTILTAQAQLASDFVGGCRFAAKVL